MELAKYLEDSQEFIFVNENDKKRLKKLRKEFPYRVIRTKPPTLSEGDDVIESFELKDKKAVQHYKVVRDVAYYQRKIDDLKLKLSSTDYKITKCYEYSLVGKELPYDIVALHEEKQSYRDEIKSLEEAMKDENN